MSDFKFACPNCQQNIAVTSEYSGAQINCPSCQTPIVVPAAPETRAPGQGTKLTMAASTATHVATPAPFVGMPTRKKKRTGLYVGLAAGGCGILGVIIFWQQLSDLGRSTYTKYIHKEAPPVVQAPTNAPPEPPPELATDEILQNVSDTYKGLTSYAVKGLAVGVITVPATMGTPGTMGMQGTMGAPATVQNTTEGVSLELGRTNLYRVEWVLGAGANAYKGVAWSAGKGDYVGYGPYPPAKSKNRQTALGTASGASSAQCISLAQLFFDETNSLGRQAAAFAKTNGPGLATRINGRDCYVLDGEFVAHDLVLWIDKETFLIPQIQFIFGRKLDESALKGVPPAQKAQLMTWSKLKGTITETYENAETNKEMLASAFETEFAPTLTPAMQQGQPGQGRQRQRGANAGSPTQLTRRVRETQPQQ
jgi:hypothetical protein